MIGLPPTSWGERSLVWGEKTYVMAILNVTPDSFSGDGLGDDIARILERGQAAERDGADMLDVGGESTRPGHVPVNVDEELRRVVPTIQELSPHISIPISIDTSKASVAEQALKAGASIVNDVRGLTADPELASVVANAGVPVVIMHDQPADGRGDLVTSIVRELARRLDRALAAGIEWQRIIVDPGYGFGKDWRENLTLLRRQHELTVLGRPILAGTSRKRTIGHVLDVPVEERAEGTVATTALAIAGGADIVRVHDVLPNVRVARIADAVARGVPGDPEP